MHRSRASPLKCCLILLAVASMANVLTAQLEEESFYYGFKAGANYALINGVANTIIPPTFPEDSYTANEGYLIGYGGGIFLYTRFRYSKFAVQPQLSFNIRGGDFDYTDINDLEYKIRFNFQFVDLSALVKFYIVEGLAVAVGPEIGFNVAPDNIEYTSNMPALGPDLQIEQNLKEVLKGRNDFAALLGFSYDFPFGLMIEAQYRLGLSDVIETQANGFNFIETPNRTSAFQLNIAYAIPFYR